jgi:hypothetical protein
LPLCPYATLKSPRLEFIKNNQKRIISRELSRQFHNVHKDTETRVPVEDYFSKSSALV